MQVSVIFSLIAITFYALEISITDWQLSKLSPRLVVACYAVGVAIFALLSLVFAKDIKMPGPTQWIFIILMIIASFVAATAHFFAIHNNAGAIALTMFYSVMPVIASIFIFIFRGDTPSPLMIVSWVFAAISLLFLSIAQMQR